MFLMLASDFFLFALFPRKGLGSLGVAWQNSGGGWVQWDFLAAHLSRVTESAEGPQCRQGAACINATRSRRFPKHVSSFWSNLPIEREIVLESSWTPCLYVHVASHPSCVHINFLERCSLIQVLVFTCCLHIRTEEMQREFVSQWKAVCLRGRRTSI